MVKSHQWGVPGLSWLPGEDPDPFKKFNDEVRGAALQWALTRGSRSGRAAYQFARDYSGRKKLEA